MKHLPKIILIVAILGLVGVTAYMSKQSTPDEDEDAPSPQARQQMQEKAAAAKKATFKPGRVATVVTARGTFKFVLYEQDVPNTCCNFINLADKGFYNGLKFHRVESWVIQTGDPLGNGTGGSKQNIKMERAAGLDDYTDAYMVGMARKDDLNSANSQWFVNKIPAPQLQQTGPYAGFGRVFVGMDVINKIKKNDLVKKLTVAPATSEEMALINKLGKPVSAAPKSLVNTQGTISKNN